MTTRVLVVSDTHLAPTRSRRLPDAVLAMADRADLVLHAGDVLTADVLEGLGTHAPVVAVLGNNDVTMVGQLPEQVVLDLDGVRVAMVHDSGPRAGRAGRMRRRFPDADVVVFGHSHRPLDEDGVDGQRLFNPGSPTEPRGMPHPTAGWLELADGHVRVHRIVAVD